MISAFCNKWPSKSGSLAQMNAAMVAAVAENTQEDICS